MAAGGGGGSAPGDCARRGAAAGGGRVPQRQRGGVQPQPGAHIQIHPVRCQRSNLDARARDHRERNRD
ncbi:hypothetical protein FGB62_7g314 [Gracilaria domingensis]|nr:hypothetical protein FGB62_7g314 [Gracilaria domingensis]